MSKLTGSALVAGAAVLLAGCSQKNNDETLVDVKLPSAEQKQEEPKIIKGKIFDLLAEERGDSRRYLIGSYKSNEVGVISSAQFLESAKCMRAAITGKEFFRDGTTYLAVEKVKINNNDPKYTGPINTEINSVINQSNQYYSFWLIKLSTSSNYESKSSNLYLKVANDRFGNKTADGLIIGKGQEMVLIYDATQSENGLKFSPGGKLVSNLKALGEGKDVYTLGRFIVTADNKVAYAVEQNFFSHKAAIQFYEKNYKSKN